MLVVNIKSGRQEQAKLTKRGLSVGSKLVGAVEFEKNWRVIDPVPPAERAPQMQTIIAERLETKTDSKRDKAWLASVRLLPCVKCGKPPPCEAAHSNQMMWGKGKGTKANDRATFPLCGNPCHVEHDTKRPADWREMENRWIVDTMLKVLSKNV